MKSLQLWYCLWLVGAPCPRVLAPAIIFCSFGSPYLWWTVCFHAFQSSPVSWPITQLPVWALRSCILDAHADCAICVCARMQTVSLCMDSQPYQCQRSAPGTPCCLLLWQTDHWSSWGQGWHNTDLCHPHSICFVLGPLKEVRRLSRWMRKGPPFCFGAGG